MSEEGPKMSFLEGEYNEVESASSFQEALRHWRGEKTDGSGESMREDAMWTPIRPGEVHIRGWIYYRNRMSKPVATVATAHMKRLCPSCSVDPNGNLCSTLFLFLCFP